MDLGIKGRTALVTGASQGIGREIAKTLSLEGVKVIGAARRANLVEELSKEAVAAGGEPIIAMEADLYDPATPERLASAAEKRLGKIDILINSAGGSRPIPFDAPREAWEEGMTINFYRIRELTHALVPGMRERQWGRIVNLTGTSEPRIINAAFTAKAACHVWSKGLSRDIAADNVTINCLSPGRIRSEQLKRRYPTLADELAHAEAEIPAGRFGEPHEIAGIAVFLASERGSYITGTVLTIDGGKKLYAF